MPPFPKGRSGNPHGRPAKSMTYFLNQKLDEKVDTAEGRMAIKSWLAAAVAQALMTGRVQLEPEKDTDGNIINPGRVLTLGNTDWTALVAWVFNRIDGTPMQTIDHQSMGKALAGMPVQQVVEMLRDGLAELERQNATIVDAPPTLEAMQ